MHFALLISAAATAAAVIVLLLAGCAAIRATTRFVSESFFGKELLFRNGKNEIDAAITAGQGFVLSHMLDSLLKKFTHLVDGEYSLGFP